MKLAHAIASAATLVLIAAQSALAVLYDGSITGDSYGAPLAVQGVQTQFGDDLDHDTTVTGIKGSELDAAYARRDGGVLNLAITGNLEDNFNKLVLFFDSKPGGFNTIHSFEQPLVDPSPFPSDPGMFQKMEGFTFDAGFTADYVLVLRHGYTGTDNRFDADFAVMGPSGVSNQYLGVFTPTSTSPIIDWTGSGSTGTGAANGLPIMIALDNNNILGVTGGTGPADPSAAAAVTTGIEIGMPMANIGNPTGAIKITAYVVGHDQDFLSNQFLGTLPAFTGNLGNPSFVDLDSIPGNQYFTVAIPEPSAALLNIGPTLACAFGCWLSTRLTKRRQKTVAT